MFIHLVGTMYCRVCGATVRIAIKLCGDKFQILAIGYMLTVAVT